MADPEALVEFDQRIAIVRDNLRELVEQSRWDEAERAARDVLHEWPGSEAARDALALIQAQRRRQRAHNALHRAVTALEAGDPAAADPVDRESSGSGFAPDRSVHARNHGRDYSPGDSASQCGLF